MLSDASEFINDVSIVWTRREGSWIVVGCLDDGGGTGLTFSNCGCVDDVTDGGNGDGNGACLVSCFDSKKHKKCQTIRQAYLQHQRILNF